MPWAKPWHERNGASWGDTPIIGEIMNEKANEIQLSALDAAAAKHNAAYAAFASMYAARVPQPVAPTFSEDWLTKIILLALVSASVIVSGSRTISEFGGGLVGVSAFIMLELGIVAYGYIRTRRYYDEQRHYSTKRMMTLGMMLAFAVALAANIHATLKQNQALLEGGWLDTAILLLVAVSAPALAFIAGDALGMEDVASRRKRAEAMRHYQQALQEWQQALNLEWQKSQLYRSVRVSAVQPILSDASALSMSALDRADMERTQTGHANGYSKRMNARALAREYLAQNPDALNGTSRELAQKLRIGKSTAADVLREIKEARNENG